MPFLGFTGVVSEEKTFCNVFPLSSSHYLKSEFNKQSTIHEVNLKNVLIPCTSCFVAVTNFSGVNIRYSIDVPIIIRRYFPVYRVNDFGNSLYVYVTPGHNSAINRDTSSRIEHTSFTHQNEMRNCSSNYLVVNLKSVCLAIKIQTYVFNSKPWSYVQNLYIFPPMVNYTFPKLFSHTSNKINSFVNSGDKYLQSRNVGVILLDSHVSSVTRITFYLSIPQSSF